MSPAPFMAYAPPGPVAARFLASRAVVQAIMGPVGSGKTGAALMKFLYVGMAQAPHPRDAVRRTKFAVVRDSYRNLEKTTIKSWNRWVPRDLGHWIGGSGGQPATHTVRFAVADGTTVEIIVEFIGLGEDAAANVMPGWEGTGVYLNEADHLARETLTYVLGRIGRYPPVDAAAGFAGPTWRGVWADFNAPDVDHWLYRDFVEALPPDWEFVEQPGAMVRTAIGYAPNPAAENLPNLPAGYYEQQVAGQPEWYIRRLILNKWGASRDGQPVYDDWNDTLHAAPAPLEPVPELPLVIGADAGLTPALVILQQMPSGQWRALDELVAPPTGMGARRFGETLNRLLAERYRPWARAAGARRGGQAIQAWGDPSAASRSSTDETTWLQVMTATTGITFRAGPTNKPTLRLDSVRAVLTRLIDGAPGFLVSPRCKILRKGFNSGYRLRRIQASALSERFADEPDKNEFSHVHDALQYAVTGAGGHLELLGRQRTRATGAAVVMASTTFDPYRS